MKTIILTGGGTAGHVTPNLALVPELKKEGWDIKYIGSKNGIEKSLVEKEGIPFYGISSGKLRRYISKENITDMFKVVKGIGEATRLIGQIKPDVVFSKGGFVAVPIVLGAKLKGVPVIVHESDITPGLANKIAIPFAKAVCTTFPETAKYIKGEKTTNTGTPIRGELFLGNKKAGRTLCGFNEKRPILLIMGGSLGAVKINNCVRECLKDILLNFQVIHICGKGNMDNTKLEVEGYKQFEYISEELPNVLAASDIIVSRAGANAISEFLALKKPALLIPLSAKASRGDQILNAESFRKRGLAEVLKEEDMSKESLKNGIDSLYKKREKYIEAMSENEATNRSGTSNVIRCIKEVINV